MDDKIPHSLYYLSTFPTEFNVQYPYCVDLIVTKVMKKLFAVICVFLLSCSKPADFYYLDGSEGQLEMLKGNWLLINFWAEWCKPCLEEIPEINHFYQEFHQQVKVIGINFDKLPQQTQLEQQQKWQIEYPLVINFPLQELSIKMPGVLPVNLIVSPEGKVVKTLKGPQSREKLLKAFKELGVAL